jgi:precorrin-2 dehydrogenase/sirohydrochlorin ferrochelatase
MPLTPDYPINLRIAGKPVLLVGGGDVAESRVSSLLACQAVVTVVSPTLTPGLQILADAGEISHLPRKVKETDIEGNLLVLAATDDHHANESVARWARARNILVNVADDPPNLDFAIPAQIRRGDLLVTVSTSGASPGYAGDLRRRLEPLVDEAEAQALEIIREQRERVRPVITDRKRRFAAINHLVKLGLADVIRREGIETARTKAEHAIAEWIPS